MLLTDLSSTRDSLIEELSHMREKNNTLNNRLALLREQTSEESKAISDLETECKQIESTIASLNETQQQLKVETIDLKSLNGELKEQIELKSAQLKELEETRVSLSGQIVSSPEKFRRQILEVGQTLQAEQKDGKAAEKKVRELSAWLVNVEDTQNEVNGSLEAIYELRAEVERQKAVMSDVDAQRTTTVASRVALSELDQNVRQLQRHGSRAEEKLQHLHKQVTQRGAESQRCVEDLHQNLMEAEAFRVQVASRVERQEGEAARLEQELAAEEVQQQAEVNDLVASYKRLERVVTGHMTDLQNVLQKQMQLPPSPTRQQPLPQQQCV